MKTVLIVEDTDLNIDLLTQLLEDDYNLLVARDGQEGVAMALEHTPDLILMDVVMPGMNGKELAMRLRSHFAELKVLYMSGYSDNPPVTGDEAQGHTTFLQKPFSPEDLIRMVREILHSVSPA